MCDCDQEYLFPDFARKALLENKNKKKDSKVSCLWSDLFKLIYSLALDYETNYSTSFELNPNLSSHCGKKRSNYIMGESDLGPIAQIFRAGWEMRNVHTLFDYITGTENSDKRAGKVISGWNFKVGDSYYGGYPPALQDIVDRPELVSFCTLLLC